MLPRRERFAAHVQGRVQGVGFRAFVCDTARELEIAGSVRNGREGGVWVEAEGARDRLERLLSALRAGPPAAQVDRVTVNWMEPKGETRFTALPT
jgi:acylphosphatase